MTEIFLYCINSIMPLLLLVFLGYFLRRSGLFTDEFLKVGNKYVFYAAIPVSLFLDLYNTEDPGSIQPSFLLALLSALAVLTVCGYFLAHACTDRRDRYAVLMQSAFRSNYAAVGLVLATSLAGSAAGALGALAAAVTVGYFNIMSVICLSVYAGEKGKRPDVRKLVADIFKNPLIRGIFLGICCIAARMLLKMQTGSSAFFLKEKIPFLFTALSYIAATAAPMALITLGGMFRFRAAHDMKKEITAGVLACTVLKPAIGFFTAMAVGMLLKMNFSPAVYAVFTGAFCTPMAAAFLLRSLSLL